MNVYYIDLSGITTTAALHERLRTCLDLPDYYGANLDALHDILSERRDLDLIFYNTEKAERALPAYLPMLRGLCSDLAAEFGHFIRFYP